MGRSAITTLGLLTTLAPRAHARAVERHLHVVPHCRAAPPAAAVGCPPGDPRRRGVDPRRGRVRALLDASAGGALRLHGADDLPPLRRQARPRRGGARGPLPRPAAPDPPRAALERPPRDDPRAGARLRAVRPAQPRPLPRAHHPARHVAPPARRRRGGARAPRAALAPADRARSPRRAAPRPRAAVLLRAAPRDHLAPLEPHRHGVVPRHVDASVDALLRGWMPTCAEAATERGTS